MKREIEIKYLLGGKEEKNRLVDSLKQHFPGSSKIKSSKVISYFYQSPDSKEQVLNAASVILRTEDLAELEKLVTKSPKLVVKARSIDNTVQFAVKGAAEGQDAVHAVNRIEFETVIDNSLEELNQQLTNEGIQLVSKWSADRSFYKLNDNIEMNIEFVSGYGYKAELEILVDESEGNAVETQIRDAANKLSLEEASQELFGRMYEYYNEHWQEYFNTDKVFPIYVWEKLGRTHGPVHSSK